MQPNGSHEMDLGERRLATSEVVSQRGGNFAILVPARREGAAMAAGVVTRGG